MAIFQTQFVSRFNHSSTGPVFKMVLKQDGCHSHSDGTLGHKLIIQNPGYFVQASKTYCKCLENKMVANMYYSKSGQNTVNI